MSILMQSAVQEYLAERRRLGFQLSGAGGQLMRFARFADAREHRGPLTLDLQLDWAREHVLRTSQITWARRLEVVRPFAAYYKQFEPLSVVPDATTFGRGHRRKAPHIYTDQELADLIDAAGRLQPRARAITYATLFGLIASAGLRVSEALHLRDGDVDPNLGSITIRQTKFNKSRRLPLHSSVLRQLVEYRKICKLGSGNHNRPFFESVRGEEISKSTVHFVFDGLRKSLQWVSRGGHANPRIHDLRHTFAVRRVKLWHESGTTIDHGMLLLCTYLGHAKISDTYWYLSGVPELMGIAGRMYEEYATETVVTRG